LSIGIKGDFGVTDTPCSIELPPLPSGVPTHGIQVYVSRAPFLCLLNSIHESQLFTNYAKQFLDNRIALDLSLTGYQLQNFPKLNTTTVNTNLSLTVKVTPSSREYPNATISFIGNTSFLISIGLDITNGDTLLTVTGNHVDVGYEGLGKDVPERYRSQISSPYFWNMVENKANAMVQGKTLLSTKLENQNWLIIGNIFDTQAMAFDIYQDYLMFRTNNAPLPQ